MDVKFRETRQKFRQRRKRRRAEATRALSPSVALSLAGGWKILGGNDVGGVAGSGGAYIDFGPSTGRGAGGREEDRVGGSYDIATRRAEQGRAGPSELRGQLAESSFRL